MTNPPGHSKDPKELHKTIYLIFPEEVNSSHLDASANEVVVYLPASVAESERRISFVVFRNDRAFQPTNGTQYLAVNSRVLSVNVDNITQFQDGEVSAIYN